MIPNLRDVGKTVNRICDREIMHEGMLYRGGTVNKLADESELPDVRTILNLRTEEDQVFPSKRQLHIPAIDSAGNYLTLNGTVRDWVNKVAESICAEGIFPLLLHCTYGKDRTGIITALILLAIGIERPVGTGSVQFHTAENIKVNPVKSEQNTSLLAWCLTA